MVGPDAWKSTSAPDPSLTVPAVGGVLSRIRRYFWAPEYVAGPVVESVTFTVKSNVPSAAVVVPLYEALYRRLCR